MTAKQGAFSSIQRLSIAEDVVKSFTGKDITDTKEALPQQDKPLILEDEGFNNTFGNNTDLFNNQGLQDITNTTEQKITDPTNNQIIHDLNDEKDPKKIDTRKIIKNDVDEFGQPRLIERKSRGKMFFVSNPLFKGSGLNSRGEETHMVYVKNGIRSVYPDRTYRKSDTLVSSSRLLVRIADLFDKQ